MSRIMLLSLAAVGWVVSGCAGGQSSRAASNAVPAPPGAIAITVTEKGFEPAEIRVHRGQPVTLVVTRRTEKTCATEFVMKSQGIDQPLPMNKPVTITFTPTEPGELRYACGMDMIAGTVIVE